MMDGSDWMQDPSVVSSFDPAVQDALADVSGLTHLMDGYLPGPGDATFGWIEPPVLFHPDEFTLNGFPYEGTDPTEPGYWNPPSL
jgi:hypothetical protein